MTTSINLKSARVILFLAALYNIMWGAYTSIFPDYMLFGESASVLMIIYIRCIGMLVGVYGIAYFMSSLDPARYWPLILTGLIGKTLGPIGAVYYIYKDLLDANFFYVNLFNDIIWILPFSWVLIKVYQGCISPVG